MRYTYTTQGTCARTIEFDLDGDVVTNVIFKGGCNGNLKGISSLVNGMTVSEIAEKLGGTTCGFKSTSCPDQLAKAVTEAYNSNK